MGMGAAWMIWILVEEIFVFRLLDIGLAAFGRRSLFRRWIQTFPEIELGTVQSQSEFTEGFVDAVSGDEDIVEYRYWSVLAEAVRV